MGILPFPLPIPLPQKSPSTDGTYLSSLGTEENMLLDVRAYTPPFTRCVNTPPQSRPVTSACASIIANMRASMAQTRFGAQGIEDVDQHLPIILNSDAGTCKIKIDIVAPEDSTSWYNIWGAAVALDGMCARGGRAGKVRFLGK